MGWLDNLRRRGEQAVTPVTPVTAVTRPQPDRGEAPPRPVVRAAPRPKPKLEHVWITTRAPANAGDPGHAEIGFYTVEDGAVVMRDENGKALGARQALGPDDNPKVIAGLMRKAAWSKAMGEGNFNRRLSYPKSGVA